MSDTLIKDVATRFSLSENQLLTKGVKAFLQDELNLMAAELKSLCAKHGAQTLEDLDMYVTEHPDEESRLLSDLQRADYLSGRGKEILGWMKELNGNR